jgi:hypothetical protein
MNGWMDREKNRGKLKEKELKETIETTKSKE